MRENSAAAARPRKPSFHSDDVKVEDGVTLYIIRLPATCISRRRVSSGLPWSASAYEVNDRRCSRKTTEHSRLLRARCALALKELLAERCREICAAWRRGRLDPSSHIPRRHRRASRVP